MIKALVIVPYEGLYEMMKEINREVDDIQLQIELGNLHEGVVIAKEAENKGYHVIISRGGTASMIQEAVSIPVIDIQVSGYDVLRILTLVKGFSGKAAIVGFSNITQGAATICKILDFDVKALTITKEAEVIEKLTSLKENGYDVVIGDVVTVQAAKKLGMTGVLITSGREAIMDALEETRRSYRIFSSLQKDVNLFQSILDMDDKAIGIFNKEEKIIYGNGRFNQDFDWKKFESLNEIKTLLKDVSSAHETQTKAVYIENAYLKITIHPKENATVFIVERIQQNPETEEGENGNQDAVEFHTSLSFISISGKSEPIRHVLRQIDQYSQREENIWISGEIGNGKELIAKSIYLHNRKVDEPFIVLHGDVLNTERLKGLIEEKFFQKYANAFIYLKNVDKLNAYCQKELYHLIKNKNGKRQKWLVSSTENMEELIQKGILHRELLDILAQLKIQVPPLRERKEDMEELVHVFISELHAKYGSGVLGIRSDALEELVNYDWPGNVGELKKVINQLFLQAGSYYIEKDEVKKVLKQVMKQEKKDIVLAQIDINSTLEEIEKQVIQKVLEEEGLNQSKAAKRLGINRSTLWRKLK